MKQKQFNKMTGQWETRETIQYNSILPRNQQSRKPINYKQKLKNAKAKDEYRKYQTQKTKQQVQQTKQGLQKTGSLIKKFGKITFKQSSRLTNKVKPKEKLYANKWQIK